MVLLLLLLLLVVVVVLVLVLVLVVSDGCDEKSGMTRVRRTGG